MLNVRKFIPALVFAISIAPLAANAKGADVAQQQQAPYVMVTSAANQTTVSRFPGGRAAERMSAQPDTTAFVAIPQSVAANITSSLTATSGG
jgi:hypothetical protein